ncbi:MraY family glycosyltransferase [Natronospira bacteriovora]|uniref:Glycosyltransferase family 4 protein n=1 Tax=Natronospira bacteriovora TaxID=3069753 RepID=A0ABU0W831_9GAMM|nr:glycosyltransferase family 4 protein [Natronospira sp. AB-CW4]MDQ2070112.1 glycosyltransferase family 4 protein [Natronospira sp. AB-CW4]
MNGSMAAVSLAAILLSALGCGLWRPLARRLGFVDEPNHRSLHERPMVRSGGLPMALALLLVLLPAFTFQAMTLPWPLLLALMLAAGLTLVSALDDRIPLPVLPRLGSHLLACVLFVALGPELPAWLDAWPLPALLPVGLLAVLALAWLINLYNFMDGSDGLAGGQGVIGFAALGGLALMADAPETALVAFAISGCCLGFLFWNAPPARLFLGDAGAIPLGFLAGALSLQLWLSHAVPPWLTLLPFAPFWADASITLLRRLWRGERIMQAHREHYYQRLVQSGWGHGKTALLGWGLMLFAALAALAGQYLDHYLGQQPGQPAQVLLGQAALVTLVLLSLLLTAFWIARRAGD